MATPSTVPHESTDVEAFLAAVTPAKRRRDARTVCTLMEEVTGEPAVLWGDSIVGFGRRVLHPSKGHDRDWMLVGFSPRKAATTLYLSGSWNELRDQLARLGPHSTGVGCLYLKDVDAVDVSVLREVVADSVARARAGDQPARA